MSLDVRGDMGVTGHTRGRQCHLHKRTHGCHWVPSRTHSCHWVHIPSPQSAFIFRDVRLRGFWMTQWRKDHMQGELRGAEGPEPGGAEGLSPRREWEQGQTPPSTVLTRTHGAISACPRVLRHRCWAQAGTVLGALPSSHVPELGARHTQGPRMALGGCFQGWWGHCPAQ